MSGSDFHVRKRTLLTLDKLPNPPVKLGRPYAPLCKVGAKVKGAYTQAVCLAREVVAIIGHPLPYTYGTVHVSRCGFGDHTGQDFKPSLLFTSCKSEAIQPL